MDDRTIQDLESRIKRLEEAVFGNKQKPIRKQRTADDFSGATGGVRFLISKGFFKKKHGLSDVRVELSDNGYHYRKQAVNNAVSRLSSKGGPLVFLEEGGRKVYVERK